MHDAQTLWRRAAAPLRLLLSAMVCMAMLASCGGDGVGTGGTGSFASGPITGYGSIIVGGVEFDDAGATVLDDDGAPIMRNGNELRLGMTVDVEGRAITRSGNGKRASGVEVRMTTAVLGPVETIDAASGTVVVLGQTVQITAATAFGPSLRGGISSLRTGDVIAIHGLPDVGSQRYIASRVEPAHGARVWRLRGIVSGLDAAARTLRVGQALLDYSAATGVPPELANGRLVRITLASSRTGGSLTVLTLGLASPAPGESDETVLEGLVTSQSTSTVFSVNGVAVEAGQAPIEPAGSAVAPGAYVVVEGTVSNGRVLASRIRILTRAGLEARPFQVAGVVANLDASAATIVVRNVSIDYSSATFSNGSAARLAPGVGVHVTGPLSADGTQVRAVHVAFD